MIRMLIAVALILQLNSNFVFGQPYKDNLGELATKLHSEYLKNQAEIEQFIVKTGMFKRYVNSDGTVFMIEKIENGTPIIVSTSNFGAAKTTQTDDLWPGGSLGLSLSGSGYDKIGIWDGGKVLSTHQEFDGRVTQRDAAATTNNYATFVAGTLVAKGAYADAKGMAAFACSLKAYDFGNDASEMATAAGAGMEISNHSYGQIRGWSYYNSGTSGSNGDSLHWFGDIRVDNTEDFRFGYYSSDAANWDEIAYNAPNYLIVKAAGNDRDDSFPGRWHYHYDFNTSTWVYANDPHGDDGGAEGYDCMLPRSCAKNILTVGAVNEVLDYANPNSVSMSNFSDWGPTDDGRIKPDLVAKGVDLTSSSGTGNSNYLTGWDGTSFSSPNVAGTLALLQQYNQSLYGGSILRSATLKALAIHSASEAGTADGPDYQFGWGLLNANYAAEIIKDDAADNTIDELTLNNGQTYTRDFISDGIKPIKVTIAWTDPKGTPITSQPTFPDFLDNQTPMLVNDLDLKVTKDGSTYYPWKLERDNPSGAATNTGKNYVDNVEQVFIKSPVAGTYTAEITHDGTLSGGSQDFSLILTPKFQGLPVELSLFFVENSIAGVKLNWTTESEIENLGFVLERKTETTNWTEIASYNTDNALLGQGSVEYATDYEYVDSLVEAGVAFMTTALLMLIIMEP